jgi:hypothetical protein
LLPQHADVEEDAPPPLSYDTLPESNGCKGACLLHLVMLGGLLTLLTMWIIRNKAWELEFTLELQEKKEAAGQKADVSGEK